MSRRAYLDHNATSPLLPEARAAMLEVLDHPGNPSSVHKDGRAARVIIEAARAEVAALVGAAARGVIFTSGATEAAALALHPLIEEGGAPRPCDILLVSAVEHACVLRGHRFPPDAVETLPVDANGVLDLAALEAALARHAAAGRRAMVALMLANNETGALQPVAEAAHIAKAYGALIFCDAVQAPGRIAFDMSALGVDFLALSAHKMGGPQGAGALICAREVLRPQPLLAGGGQERGRRAGTENVASIAGFGAAARAVRAPREAERARLARLRDALEAGLQECVPNAHILARDTARLPNTSCIAFDGMRAETVVIALDLAGLSVSAGSACSSGKVGASHVLQAMGVPKERAESAIRLSFGWNSTHEDVETAIAAVKAVVAQKKGRPAQAA